MQNYHKDLVKRDNSKFKIFAFLILFSIFYFLFSGAVLAQGYQLETKLPPLPGAAEPGAGIAQYIQYMYIFALALAGFLALGMMVLGGLQYVLAAGNVAKVEDAKDMITQALWGLGLLLVSYLLLRTINPDLVSLRNPDLKPPAIKSALQGQSPAQLPGVVSGQACASDSQCDPNDPFVSGVCQSGQCQFVPRGTGF